MDFKLIIEYIYILAVTIFLSMVIWKVINIIDKYLRAKNKYRSMEISNKKIELFMQLDPKLMEQEIDDLILKYLNDYVLKHFTIMRIDYISDDECENMIRTLRHDILLDLSELYIFYIKNLVNLTSDDDLVEYMNKKIKDHVLLFITDFNKPRENDKK